MSGNHLEFPDKPNRAVWAPPLPPPLATIRSKQQHQQQQLEQPRSDRPCYVGINPTAAPPHRGVVTYLPLPVKRPRGHTSSGSRKVIAFIYALDILRFHCACLIGFNEFDFSCNVIISCPFSMQFYLVNSQFTKFDSAVAVIEKI